MVGHQLALSFSERPLETPGNENTDSLDLSLFFFAAELQEVLTELPLFPSNRRHVLMF